MELVNIPLNLIETSDEWNTTRHPKCAGYSVTMSDYVDYGCRYDTLVMCDDCKYNNQPFGRKDPEAKCNQA